MISDITSYPPAAHDYRPERDDRDLTQLDLAVRHALYLLARPIRFRLCGFDSMVRQVNAHKKEIAGLSDKEIRAEAASLAVRLRRDGFLDEAVARSFALVRESAGRTIGMRHYDNQLMGGLTLLKGMMAEMETGEGKTLMATLAATTAALAGIQVHIITVNDYLTERDSEWMRPVYEMLGLTVGCITHGLSTIERREQYECDITYCTNKEIVFDYLRDTMTMGELSNSLRLRTEALHTLTPRSSRLMLRGLQFAITDEADSLLIDESRTPLIISGAGSGTDQEEFWRQAMDIAASLDEGSDYLLDIPGKKIELTGVGEEKIKSMSSGLGVLWIGSIRCSEVIRNALTALHHFDRDIHYLLLDGKVQIIDEFTGRVMPGRSWERGLQQLIEIKEGCEVTKENETLARISYQRFFRRYLHLSGMTGTAKEVAGELSSVYGLDVVRIPTNKELIRLRGQATVFPDVGTKWRAVVERVSRLNQEGRPVLIGTRTVAASEKASLLFSEAGLTHQVLNAKNFKEESEIIARAGERGRITIATNMAGRGTDIKLEEGVAELGGLHVIITERHDAARIDRQLAGRCARQGDPGSYEIMVSLEDELFDSGLAALSAKGIARLCRPASLSWRLLASFAARRAQRAIERRHAKMRKQLLKHDELRVKSISFAGRSE